MNRLYIFVLQLALLFISTISLPSIAQAQGSGSGSAPAGAPKPLFAGPPMAVIPGQHGIAAVEGDVDTQGLAWGARALRLRLPGGTSADLELVDLDRRGPANVGWRGRVTGNDDSGVTLTLKHGLIFGRLRIGQAVYEIKTRQNGRLVVEELDVSSFPACSVGTDHIDHREHGGPAQDLLDSGSQSDSASAGDASVVIDLLSVYSNDALAHAGSVAQMEATIQAAVDAANAAFINSNVNATYRLVHMALVDYDVGNGGTGDALSWVRNSGEVAALRNEHGADMVSIIVDTLSSCGTGYVQRNPGPGFEDWAFQATDIDCAVGNLTFAHENGHNLGMEHNPENSSIGSTPEDASYPWSFGHYVDGSFRTVMSYSAQCTSSCSRIAHLSNPQISHNGAPTGIEGSRDNARTGNLTTPIAAAFRAAVTAPPPPPPPGNGTVDVRIAVGSDDVEESHSDGSVYLDSSDLELGNDPSFNGNQTIGLRFNNLNIPQGANIISAYLEFVTDETDSITTAVSIGAHATDNAPAFSATANDVTGRPLTLASTTWNISTWNTLGEVVRSPDISAVVQEVVNRSGWSANNSMAFVINGTGTRTAEAYEGVASAAPRLRVEYDTQGANQVPTANFDFTTENLTASFSDSSSDADGSIASRSWSFGDGGNSTATNPSHTFGDAGTYSVTLTVTDNNGAANSISRSVTVTAANQAPMAEFGFNTSALTADFTDASTDSDGSIAGWSWDFGDGNTSSAQNPSHTYVSAGSYTVMLTVTDNGGDSHSTSQSVTVSAENESPTAAFGFSVSDLTASFTDASTDNDGSIAGWSWDFGDGNTSSAQNPSHTYVSAGSYTVMLTVTDNGGDSHSTSQSVTVTSPDPQPPAVPSNLTADVVKSGKGRNKTITSVTLSWWDNSNNETRFEVERCLEIVSGKGKNRTVTCDYTTVYATVGENVTSLSVGTESGYRYRIRAVNDMGPSAFSNEVKT